MTIITDEGMPPSQRHPYERDATLRANPFEDLPELRENPFVEDSGTPGVYIAHAYSGVDIKLVAHLPREEIAQEETELGQAESDLAELEQLLEITADGPDRVELLEEIAVAAEAIEELRTNQPENRAITKVLAEIQTLSLSVYRQKQSVQTLGAVYPRGVTRGPRTVAGSMVFTHFHRHLFSDFMGQASHRSTGVGDWDNYRWTSFVPDQLPPMDISIVFANEYGNLSWMAILGVEFMNEGMVMSIEDLFIEGTIQYIARDFDPLRNAANRPSTRTHGVGQQLTGTSLLAEHLTNRVAGRRNPFI